ncbi:SufB/SufD family protein [Caldivirga sp. UBA161]|uniref:SufB/SufD family protein n=1 Tax=Caldivirga sp. UBA161 TaxID=1915569 RepID=UPI0025BDBA7F|nr:SufD family Fe-S cluster assembly protein [Caldivirga sp. UBA161]
MLVPEEIKVKARELAGRIPYQLIKDSPTVKYYTQWSLFDNCVESNNGNTLPPSISFNEYDMVIHNGTLIKGNELTSNNAVTSIDPSESRIIARHFINIREMYSLTLGESSNIRVMMSYSGGGSEMNSNHIIINVNEGALANIFLSIIGNGGCGTNIVELNVNDGAIVNLLIYSVNVDPAFNLIRVNEGVRAKVNSYSIVVNGKMTHHREDYILKGRESIVNVNSLEVGLYSSRIDYMVNLTHYGEGSSSNSITKAIALDSATVIHRGFGRISDHGKWSYTNIEGKVFIGSSNAVGMSVPVIMVDTGDVNGARHSASDASLDEDQELYFRMRGLSREEAIKLITYDMIMNFLDNIDNVFEGSVNYIRGSLLKLLRI